MESMKSGMRQEKEKPEKEGMQAGMQALAGPREKTSSRPSHANMPAAIMACEDGLLTARADSSISVMWRLLHFILFARVYARTRQLKPP